MQKILLVDDEPDILEILSYNLEKSDYLTFTAESGLEAIELAKKEIPDLIVLDVMMPNMDGIETCIELRSLPELSNAIIVFLSARNEDYSLIAGLDAGADDYITKPINPRVFVKKVETLLKRKGDRGNEVTVPTKSIGNLTIDSEKYLVFKGEQKIEFSKKKFELLALLASKPGKVFTRDEILTQIWSDNVIVNDRTIDVHIRKIREQLGDDYIKTIKGVGYKFSA
jgi:two-component system alkaline phosphatase synthesis response regulator PhoP